MRLKLDEYGKPKHTIASLKSLENQRERGAVDLTSAELWFRRLPNAEQQIVAYVLTGKTDGRIEPNPDVDLFIYYLYTLSGNQPNLPQIFKEVYESRFRSTEEITTTLLENIPTQQEILTNLQRLVGDKDEERLTTRIQLRFQLGAMQNIADTSDGKIPFGDALKSFLQDLTKAVVEDIKDPGALQFALTRFYTAVTAHKKASSSRIKPGFTGAGDIATLACLEKEYSGLTDAKNQTYAAARALAEFELGLSNPHFKKPDRPAGVWSSIKGKTGYAARRVWTKEIGHKLIRNKRPAKSFLKGLPLTRGLSVKTEPADIEKHLSQCKELTTEDLALLVGYLWRIGEDHVIEIDKPEFGVFVRRLEEILAERFVEKLTEGDAATVWQRIHGAPHGIDEVIREPIEKAMDRKHILKKIKGELAHFYPVREIVPAPSGKEDRADKKGEKKQSGGLFDVAAKAGAVVAGLGHIIKGDKKHN